MKYVRNTIRNLFDRLIVLLMKLDAFLCVISSLGLSMRSLKALKHIINKEKAVSYNPYTTSVNKLNGRYFVRLYIPGWPSKAFRRMVFNEINCFQNRESINLNLLILGISRKCPLNCKHCLEWERLGRSETLSVEDISLIIKKFQDIGVSQVHLAGGEPMMRFNDLLHVLKIADKKSDFWLLTSGYHLTKENLDKLKNVGLTGVIVSLDHWDASLHNEFRGHIKSYDWAVMAARVVREANMPLCLSFCATKEFVKEDNLQKYYKLATLLGAQFIQIFEPRNTGRFTNELIQLDDKQIDMLERFYTEKNSIRKAKHHPFIIYSGYYQRRNGCLGGGLKNLYVDTTGEVHACPFCQGSVGNCLTDQLDDLIYKLREKGCHKFKVMDL